MMKEIFTGKMITAFTIAYIMIMCTSVNGYALEPKIISVSEGLALKDDGSVWAWGDGNPVPKQISGMTGIKQIAWNSQGFAALTENGTVWLCGDDTPPTQISVLNNVSILDSHFLLKNDGTVWLWSKVDSTKGFEDIPVQVEGLSDIVYMKDCIGLKKDGTVWEWCTSRTTTGGNPFDNIAPVKASITDVKSVSEGGTYGLALKNDGTVWAWGENTMGQLGDGTYTSSNTPVKVAGLDDIIAISAGGFHNLALKNDGTVWAWGSNMCGELSDPSSGGSPTPVKVRSIDHVIQIYAGGQTSIAVKSDGSVWAWGINTDGELGDGTITDGMIHRVHNNGKDTPVKVLLDTASNPDMIIGPKVTPCPQPSPSIQPTPFQTPNPTINNTGNATEIPTTQNASVPSPGFGFDSVAVLFWTFVMFGLLSLSSRWKKK